MEDRIATILQDALREGRRPEGLLFHGTCEEIDGKLKGGGYDGVLWTATSPVIAQQYIPASGSTVIVPRPSEWELCNSVRPDRDSYWRALAEAVSGIACKVEIADACGRAQSWTVPAGWPTYGDCVAHIENVLGYARNGYGGYEIKQQFENGAFVDKPASWTVAGELFVTVTDGLRFKDIRRSGEPDLMDVEYHDHETFAAARAEGYDGVIINDFAQTDEFGNLGHLSYGILPQAAARLEWIRIPAMRCRADIGWWSPEFKDYREALPIPAMTP